MLCEDFVCTQPCDLQGTTAFHNLSSYSLFPPSTSIAPVALHDNDNHPTLLAIRLPSEATGPAKVEAAAAGSGVVIDEASPTSRWETAGHGDLPRPGAGCGRGGVGRGRDERVKGRSVVATKIGGREHRRVAMRTSVFSSTNSALAMNV